MEVTRKTVRKILELRESKTVIDNKIKAITEEAHIMFISYLYEEKIIDNMIFSVGCRWGAPTLRLLYFNNDSTMKKFYLFLKETQFGKLDSTYISGKIKFNIDEHGVIISFRGIDTLKEFIDKYNIKIKRNECAERISINEDNGYSQSDTEAIAKIPVNFV